MAKAGIARGGDEILRPQSFYGSSPARPVALRTVDADGNSNVGLNKMLTIFNPRDSTRKANRRPREKLPEKPKSAALLFAQDEFEDQMLAQGSSFPMFDVKKFRKQTQKVVRADTLQDWQDGKVPEAVVARFVQKEAEDKARYNKEVELWNQTHSDNLLVFDSNGIAVRQKIVDKEVEEKKVQKKAKKAADKARRAKRSEPTRTEEMLEIGRKAAARLEKMKLKKASKVQYESLSEVSDDDSEGSEGSEADADGDESSAALSTDNEGHADDTQTEEPTDKENTAPRARKCKVIASTGRNATAKTRRVKKGHSMHETKTASEGIPSQPNKAVPKIVTKKQGGKRHNAREETQMGVPLASVNDQLEHGKDADTAAEREGDDDLKTKRQRGPKRRRHAQADQEALTKEGSEKPSGPGSKKAKKALALSNSIVNRQTVDAQPGANRKRVSERRSQTATEKPRLSTRRPSAEADGGQGEYCGEFALED